MANLRNIIGNAVDKYGTYQRLPELGISEFLSGGPTTNTGSTQASKNAGFLNYTPYAPNVLGVSSYSSSKVPASGYGSQFENDLSIQEKPSSKISGDPEALRQAGYFQEARELEEEMQRQQEQALGEEYDYNMRVYEDQARNAERGYKTSLSDIDLQQKNLLSSIGTSEKKFGEQAQTAKDEALSAAQQTERKNRNTLRALGILNSSAAGDILSRPYQEYDKQRGAVAKALTDKLSELDTYKNQSIMQFNLAKQRVEDNFKSVYESIQTDMRASAKQKVAAIQQLKTAYQQRLSELQYNTQNTLTGTQTMQGQIIDAIKSLTDISSDTQTIRDVGSLSDPNTTNSNVGIYEDPLKKKMPANEYGLQYPS